MNEIEDRLRDAFRADARTVRTESLRPFERPAGSGANAAGPARPARRASDHPRVNVAGRGMLIVPLAAALAVAVIAFGVVLAGPSILRAGHRPPTRYTPSRPGQTFLTVTTSPLVFKGGYLARYPVTTLQLRSIRHGRVIATLLRSLGLVDAVMTRTGNVIAVADFGCRSQVLRIDPRTRHTTLIRTLPQTARDVALSPDGRELAYITYPPSDPQPCRPARQPIKPVPYPLRSGLQLLPSALAIVNLGSGAVVTAARPGDWPGDPAWSPDGSMIAITDSGEIQLLSATHPDFATARRVSPPRHCSFVTSTWTRSGLLAVLSCGSYAAQGLAPGTLVRLTTAGQRASTWRLPACINGVDLRVDPTTSQVLLQTDIGYGDVRPCGYPRSEGTSIRVFVVRPTSLDTIAVFPQNHNDFGVTGW